MVAQFPDMARHKSASELPSIASDAIALNISTVKGSVSSSLVWQAISSSPSTLSAQMETLLGMVNLPESAPKLINLLLTLIFLSLPDAVSKEQYVTH